jgi:hypothetical protein
MKTTLACVALLALAACGADGEPVTPTASTGVTPGAAGLFASSAIGVQRGPFAVTLGRRL